MTDLADCANRTVWTVWAECEVGGRKGFVRPLCERRGMTEARVSLYEARNRLGHLVVSATHGDYRYVIYRYGTPYAAIIGIADLEYLRDREKELIALKAQLAARVTGAAPPPPPKSEEELEEERMTRVYLELRDRALRGDWQSPRSAEEAEMMLLIGKEIFTLKATEEGRKILATNRAEARA